MLPFPDTPPNFLGMAVAARRLGQEDRRQQARDNALGMMATNPEGAKSALMAAGDFETANAVDQQVQQATRKRVLGQYATDPTGAQTSAMQAGDPALIEAVSKLDDRQKADALERAQRLAAVAYKLKVTSQDPAARKAAALSIAPALQGIYGFTSAQLAGFDYSDAGLDALIGQGAKLSELITSQDKATDNTRQQGQLDELMRHNKAMEEAAMVNAGANQTRAARAGRGGAAQSSSGVPHGFVLE